jgi:toxin HigB-1
VIVSFGDRTTEDLYHGRPTRYARGIPPGIVSHALRKLDVLNAASRLLDLASPPGNRLEALRGKLRGRHSIRINDQWRIVFRWEGSDAHEVRITDYHGG